jgi:serine/threonine protein kinase
VAGTPEFMSPEQAAGRPDQIDHRTDQFSLAAIAYTLLTGREPFRGDDPLAILQQVVYFDPLKPSRLVPALSAGIDAVVMRGLAKKPDDRFADVLTFADALRGAIEAALHGAPDHLPAELEPPPIRAMAHAPGGWQPAEPWSEGPAGPETKQLIRKVRWGIRAGRMARIAMTLVTVSAIAVLAWFAPPTRAATRLSFSRAGQNARIVYQRAVAATTQRR